MWKLWYEWSAEGPSAKGSVRVPGYLRCFGGSGWGDGCDAGGPVAVAGSVQAGEAQPAPVLPDLAIPQHVEDEDEESLDGVEDAEEILEDQLSILHGQEAEDPRQSWKIEVWCRYLRWREHGLVVTDLRWIKEWICSERPITICSIKRTWLSQGPRIWPLYDVTRWALV